MLKKSDITTARFAHEEERYVHLEIETRANIGFIRLREGSGWTIDEQLLTEIALVHERFEYDENIHGVIWSTHPSGGALGALDKTKLSVMDTEVRLRLYRYFASVTRAIYAFSKPELFLGYGPVSGAGAVLMMACDWRFLSSEVRGVSFVDVMPGLQLTNAMAQTIASGIGLENFKSLIRSGWAPPHDSLKRLGLANDIFQTDVLAEKGEIFMRRLIQNPLDLMRSRKLSLRRVGLNFFDKDRSLSDAALRKLHAESRRLSNSEKKFFAA
ncbi:enoyl-CoA hydratase/isomerase family protein [Turneriella parva]|uniref:Enoyl-CoA hydratase/isomerase n=1 Tax=Turneriella parva (strain ATCC BAA-1111 / DSM 21527 / NCTC 11395 / H) TaxID=869212 RepID=I4B381_TURPD|nr:enoyl-CoA hydratase [Turneriella parva]AFM11738.1 Enoyl-CoA hydratase/isomerase [Turneriella parva DSM 21527]